MKTRLILISAFIPSILLLAAAVGLTYCPDAGTPQLRRTRGTLGTAFTYQGQLKAGAETVNEACRDGLPPATTTPPPAARWGRQSPLQ